MPGCKGKFGRHTAYVSPIRLKLPHHCTRGYYHCLRVNTTYTVPAAPHFKNTIGIYPLLTYMYFFELIGCVNVLTKMSNFEIKYGRILIICIVSFTKRSVYRSLCHIV